MDLSSRSALAALAGLILSPASPTLRQAQQRAQTQTADGERTAMLLYPRTTAHDLVGPHHLSVVGA